MSSLVSSACVISKKIRTNKIFIVNILQWKNCDVADHGILIH
jgi:hypothetical protein